MVGWWLAFALVAVAVAPAVLGALFDRGSRAGWLVVLATELFGIALAVVVGGAS